MRRTWTRISRAVIVLAGAWQVDCHKDPPAPPHPEAVASTPVAAPDGLVVDVCARGPDALWGRLKQGFGTPAAVLPQSFGGALATLARLDLTLAGEVDGAAPAFGVVARPDKAYGWVAALRLRDLPHARATLFEGTHPHFVARKTDGGLTVLDRAPGADVPSDAGTRTLTFALSPLGYLVVSSSEPDLLALAPYATRTLPARPPSLHALVVVAPHTAFAGPLKDAFDAWVAYAGGRAEAAEEQMRAAHGGKSANLADPKAVLDWFHESMGARSQVLRDVDHGELTLDAGDDSVDVEVFLTPGPGASVKTFTAMKSGDATPFLTLPDDTVGAVLFRDNPATLKDDAALAEQRAVAIFRPSLTPRDTAALHDAFAAWGASRGPWLTLGLELKDGPAVAMRTLTENAEGAMRGVSDFIDLSRVPTFKTMLDSSFSIKAVSTATVAAPGAGATSLATFRSEGKKSTTEVAVAWAVTNGLLQVAASEGSARALRASREPGRLLGSDVAFAGKLGALRDRSVFVLVARPEIESLAEAQHPTLVLGLGHDKATGWGKLEVDDALLREGITRWFQE